MQRFGNYLYFASPIQVKYCSYDKKQQNRMDLVSVEVAMNPIKYCCTATSVQVTTCSTAHMFEPSKHIFELLKFLFHQAHA